MIQNWNDFVGKLKEGKKLGVTKGISVPCITNLIYSGAFDSIVQDRLAGKTKYKVYSELFNEVKDALKSKASLPSRKKGDVVGLKDVSSDMELALWQQQMNPLAAADLIGTFMEQLTYAGYVKDTAPGKVSYRKKNKDGSVWFLLPDWAHIFKYEGTPQWRAVTDPKGMAKIVFLGIVTETEMMYYADGSKSALKFKLFLGTGATDEIVCWPEKGKYETDPYWVATIKPGTIGLFVVRPNIYKGKRGASLISFSTIGTGLRGET